jgi:very-short-patch-repair endonuclease
MTQEERLLWQHLRGNRLHGLHFRRQQVIDGFIVDFYCHAAGVVVELDGGIHRVHAAQDKERDLILRQRGLRILRFSNEQVTSELAAILTAVAKACGKGET